MEWSQPKGVKPKMTECKLRSGVNWQGTLKQRGIQRTTLHQVTDLDISAL